jgi:hypothetical protein
MDSTKQTLECHGVLDLISPNLRYPLLIFIHIWIWHQHMQINNWLIITWNTERVNCVVATWKLIAYFAMNWNTNFLYHFDKLSPSHWDVLTKFIPLSGILSLSLCLAIYLSCLVLGGYSNCTRWLLKLAGEPYFNFVAGMEVIFKNVTWIVHQ